MFRGLKQPQSSVFLLKQPQTSCPRATGRVPTTPLGALGGGSAELCVCKTKPWFEVRETEGLEPEVQTHQRWKGHGKG